MCVIIATYSHIYVRWSRILSTVIYFKDSIKEYLISTSKSLQTLNYEFYVVIYT
jgi:hypothetical protein